MSTVNRWRRWREMNEGNRYLLKHLAEESDPKANRKLAASYARYPLRLAAVVVADVFMDTDIEDLSRALIRCMGPDRPGRQDRERVRGLLRRAESKSGGKEALGPIHFYPAGEGRGLMGMGHEAKLPAGVSRVSLVLDQFAPGMVMAAMLIAPSVDMAAKTFRAHHSSPVKRSWRFGVSWKMVEAAKTRDLELQLKALAQIEMMPTSRGFLSARRYPAGTVIVWAADRDPPDDAKAWLDVARVVGIEHWQWWQGEGRRLYSSVPLDDPPVGERGGYSMIVTRSAPADETKEFGSADHALRYHLQLELRDWLPVLLLGAGSQVLGEEAGRLREKLSRRANARLRWWWLLGLGGVIGNLSDLQYRLERLRQAADADGRNEFQEFPLFVLSRPSVGAPKAPWRTRVRSIIHAPGAKGAQKQLNLRQAVLDGFDRFSREGLHEVRMSLDRAKQMSDIRSTNALLVLTAVLMVLTAILLLRTH